MKSWLLSLQAIGVCMKYTELAITNIESETSAQRRIVPFAQAFRFWLKLVFISFGGLAVAVAFARLTAFGRGLCSVLVIFAALWQFQGRAQIGDMKKKHSQNEASDEFAFPSDPLVMEKINAMIKEKAVSTDQISKRSGRTVGHLSMCLVKTPTEWSDTQLESSEWLNVLFEGQDKDALVEEVIEIYGSESYPLLSRIVDMYADVIYSEAEIGNLLEESERAMRVTKDQSAIVAVKNL